MATVAQEIWLTLWAMAQGTSLESSSIAFWTHHMSKYVFSGTDWVISPEISPSTAISPRRRVDMMVKYLEINSRLQTLCVFEAKSNATAPGVYNEAEMQAYDACSAVLNDTQIPYVYAMTAVGTKARL
ncbi:hypothetical protein H2200_002543 [Cladophialophora chaetospira]|uniref:Uncharacterized protein n=1 Tax=Cladophialophora chaetospira TaxID=386627 RepID=A0AA39CN65_9EURO|nr:hypothetical protein H2200_002543 [Cladophialophora chaetospira]